MTILNSQPFDVSVTQTQSQSVLEQAISALSLGQSASAGIALETERVIEDYEWQSRFCYDATRNIFHVLFKPANNNTAWYHRIYDVATDTWSNVTLSLNLSGHIFGNLTIDPATGNLYLIAGNSATLRRYVAATGVWAIASNDIFLNFSSETHKNGVVWHPNLFGSGQGGIIAANAIQAVTWRESDGSIISNIQNGTAFNDNTGMGFYLAAIDQAVVGDNLHIRIVPNGATPNSSRENNLPISTGGYTRIGGPNHGSMHQHPRDPTKVIIIQRRGGRNVYESTDLINWSDAGYDHPFDADATEQPWIFETIPLSGGAILGLAKNSGGTFSSRVWVPPS